ncbi:hypothetical protein VZT92_010591 [Zoarces viviparus]|uniref:Uncharacterized protein n=1 Tax=Zoarces viviparus TaxID=48416 RepID=A0AAW1F862_ZOAVI
MEVRQQVEEQVERLLGGQGSEVTGCDVGLEQRDSKPASEEERHLHRLCRHLQREGGGADGAGGEAGLLQTVVPACWEGGDGGESGGGSEEGEL